MKVDYKGCLLEVEYTFQHKINTVMISKVSFVDQHNLAEVLRPPLVNYLGNETGIYYGTEPHSTYCIIENRGFRFRVELNGVPVSNIEPITVIGFKSGDSNEDISELLSEEAKDYIFNQIKKFIEYKQILKH